MDNLLIGSVIQVAGLDPLRDEGISYGEALGEAGVKVKIQTYQGLVHGFTSFAGLPEANQYYSRLTNFIKSLKANSFTP